MKFVGLDIGDAWTGVALSDNLGMFAQPYNTVATGQLEEFLTILLKKELIRTIVVGWPKTMRGTASEQTKKVEAFKDALEQKFTSVEWVLWDERLSSKRAQALKKARTKEEKLRSHARAAAFILESYLTYRQTISP